MIKAVVKLLKSESFDFSYNVKKLLDFDVVKGFSVGPTWVVPLLAGLSHTFIDIRFEPYGFAFYPTDVKIILSIIYGVVMGGGFYLALSLLPKPLKEWALWKEVLWLIMTVIFITSINFVLRHLLFTHVFYITHLFPISYLRFLLVGAEVAGITALVFEFIQFVLVKSGVQIFPNSYEADEKVEEPLVHVVGKGKNEKLSFPPQAFVYAQSEGNYVKVFYFDQNDESLHSEMLRLSLQDFLAQLSEFDTILRIHKSFVFNLVHDHVIIGNSRRAHLKISTLELEIPVSRAFYIEHHKDTPQKE